MKWKTLFFIFVSLNSFAQISSDYTKYKAEHPNSHSVRLVQDIKVIIELEKGELHITQEIIEEDLYLDESATFNSKRSLNFSSFYEIENIEASSFLLREGKYEELKVDEFKEKDEIEDSFYDDSKSVNFIFPGLTQGARTRLKYSQKIKNPRFLNSIFFGNIYPIIANSLTIIVDKDVDIIFKEFNTENTPIEFQKTQDRRNNTYHWKAQNIDEFEFDENMPPYRSIVPHIVPIIKAYRVNEKLYNVLGDVEDLYSWYYSLTKDLNKEPVEEELVRVVDSLTKDKTNDLQKVKALYYWTQENIKYIAFEYALGGFVPREANEVFVKKYGDCKDNSSILFKMLEIAGIQGNLTWIGTREIPYGYSEMPTPLADNHMILSYEFEGETYYLDATGRYNPIELPTSFIQGKEALVGNGRDNYKIKQVPVVEAEKNKFKDVSEVTIENAVLKGKAEVEISGYIKIDYLYALEDAPSKSKVLEFYNSKFSKGNNSFLISNLLENNKNEYDKGLNVT